MELQTFCSTLSSQPLQLSYKHHSQFRCQRPNFGFTNASKYLKLVIKEPSFLGFNKFQRTVIHASDSTVNGALEVKPNGSSSVVVNGVEVEPFHGKSGSVSFYGLTHQSVEEGKLESAPFKQEERSYLWVWGPLVFISSLILPQFFISNVVEAFFDDMILKDIVTSLSTEVLFYFGFATFLQVADRVQRPYLQYSSKRWGLITGLKGYLTSAVLTMGLKISIPLILLYVTWSVIRMATVVAIAPFLVGCVVQFAFERYLNKRGSSCWPLVPIIFEVYRLYQLTRAANFAQRLMYSMKGMPASPEVLERSGTLFGMMVIFQLLGIVCLWSLMTFLLRLFPSRPVAENY
ncbi:hypothetical protein L195_g033497 [Trifolium pratense]|uniref:Uncharacterized protein n=2 Tax=Trifolium pratense TaxID=57577 RepID=A0A2K3LG68_TRIPR|nr:hypothetical protein L195_g033497 [Trifolium pratense]